MNPKILILDEPSAGLDPRARRTLINLLRELPITMLVSTHDMRLVEELFPRTIVMDDGLIVADGKTIRMTSSFGVASFPADGIGNLHELLKAADVALYEAFGAKTPLAGAPDESGRPKLVVSVLMCPPGGWRRAWSPGARLIHSIASRRITGRREGLHGPTEFRLVIAIGATMGVEPRKSLEKHGFPQARTSSRE